MRFLLNQQVRAVAGGGGVLGGPRGVGVHSLAKILTLATTSQICPVLYHAGTVLLNSLLDTVPGELVQMGWGALGSALALGWGAGSVGSCPVAREEAPSPPCDRTALGSKVASATDFLWSVLTSLPPRFPCLAGDTSSGLAVRVD